MEVVFIRIRVCSYTTEVHTISKRDRSITVENLIPVLTAEELTEQRQIIEEGLYDVFVKYQDLTQNRIAI